MYMLIEEKNVNLNNNDFSYNITRLNNKLEIDIINFRLKIPNDFVCL